MLDKTHYCFRSTEPFLKLNGVNFPTPCDEEESGKRDEGEGRRKDEGRRRKKGGRKKEEGGWRKEE